MKCKTNNQPNQTNTDSGFTNYSARLVKPKDVIAWFTNKMNPNQEKVSWLKTVAEDDIPEIVVVYWFIGKQ